MEDGRELAYGSLVGADGYASIVRRHLGLPQKKKLIGGIVLTGGGSQLKHLKQLVEYITGMDTRIGFPNEHLAGDSEAEIASPTYATAVGLLMNAVENKHRNEQRRESIEEPSESGEMVLEEYGAEGGEATRVRSERKSVLDRWADKLKEFLDNAE